MLAEGIISSDGAPVSAAPTAKPRFPAPQELRLAIRTWIERTFHAATAGKRLGKLPPIEYETTNRTALTAA
jgi:putative transposase